MRIGKKVIVKTAKTLKNFHKDMMEGKEKKIKDNLNLLLYIFD